MVPLCLQRCRSLSLRTAPHMPRGVLWFIFNLQIKDRVSYTHTYSWLLISLLILPLDLFLHTHCFIHTWVAGRWQHRSKWVHPCSLLKDDQVFSLTKWDRTPESFPSMVWLGCFLAWLAQISLLIAVPTQYLLSWLKKTKIVDVVVVIQCSVGWRGGKGVKGVRVKGWSSCYQARDQSGWGFATKSKTLAFQVSWEPLLLFTRDSINDWLYIV